MNQLQEFARPSPPGACAKATRPDHPLTLGRVATSIRDQPQMGTDTALGRRLGMCRLALAVGKTGGFGRLGCFTEWLLPLFDASRDQLGGRFTSVRPFKFKGIDGRVNARLIAIPYAADHSGNDAVEPLKCHSRNSVLYAPNLDRGGHDEIHETPRSGSS